MELCFFFLEYVLALRLGDGQFSVIFSIEKQGMIRVYARILCILPSLPAFRSFFIFSRTYFVFSLGIFYTLWTTRKTHFFKRIQI